MLLSSSLRKGKDSAHVHPLRTRTSGCQRASFALQLEALEDRRLFSSGGVLPFLAATDAAGGAITVHLAPNTTLSAVSKSSSNGHGGGSGGGTFYATAINVTQLIADIHYADTAGGTFTINLQPGTTFGLTSVDNTTDNYNNGLPVIGGAAAVNLTIVGNGDTIERVNSTSTGHGNKSTGSTSFFRLLAVEPSASLTIDGVTLKNANAGVSAVYNQGTLNVIHGSTLSGNSGGGIHNDGGAVTISDSTISENSGAGIYNNGGTVAISNGTIYDNFGFFGGGIYNSVGNVTLSNNSTVTGNWARYGGGIYNDGGTLNITDSTVLGNTAYHSDYPWTLGSGGGIYNTAGGTVTINHGTISGNTADSLLGYGGGIFNDSGSAVKLVNDSHIYGNTSSSTDSDGNPINTGADAFNYGTLFRDSTSTISLPGGNDVILI